MYKIVATMTRRGNTHKLNKAHSITKQIPTFFLDENIQGIVSEEHASIVALQMLTDINPLATFCLDAKKVE